MMESDVSEDESHDNAGKSPGGDGRTGEDGDHAVGYKRPPRGSQFKPGQSGNVKGKRKGTRNLATDVAAVRDKRVTIQMDGELREVSAQEAMLLGLIQKAFA
jgi:hypothetical protein